jgi:uncharacterized protein (DUF1810 family)
MELIGLTESNLLVKTPTVCRTMGQELRKINKRSVFFYFTMTPVPKFAGLRHSPIQQVYQ